MTSRVRLVAVGMFTCVFTAAFSAGPPSPREEMRSAMRQARDGDLQADWNKLLDVRGRFSALTTNGELAPLAHYYVGYTDWRLSSLAFIAGGPRMSATLAARAVTAIEPAIQKRPDFADAHALLATCLATWLYADPSQADRLIPRIRAAWEAALPGGASNPRVMLLRAMSLTFAPPPYGDREKGLKLWREAIQAFAAGRPEDLSPAWGDVEAIAWLGGAYLAFNQPKEATEWLERAVRLRPDFWWARKAALPVARRPAESE